MRTSILRTRFHRALRTSLLAALPTVVACGGTVVPTVDDGGTGDSGTDAQTTKDASKDAVVSFDSGELCRSLDIPTTSGPCGYSVTLSGDLTTCGFPADGGTIPPNVCATLCGPSTGPTTQYCYWYAGTPGVLQCGMGCEGRRPEGLRPRAVASLDVLGDHFARAAFLEAASIDAFEILEAELAHYRAPRDLLQSARVARTDEIRHARVMRVLAERFGGIVEAPVVERGPVRSLEAIALENAVEGCVRETWGALLATWQSDHAKSDRVRTAMRAIAAEEAEHALLGLRVAQWIDTKLDDGARARVAAAREAAIAALLDELTHEPVEALRVEAGLPSKEAAMLLARSLFGQLDALAA